MNAVPYDFALRVVTTVYKPELPLISESLLWTEAHRAYKEKLQNLSITFLVSPTKIFYNIRSTDSNDALTILSFADMVAKDYRFMRITEFYVREDLAPPGTRGTDTEVTDIAEFMRFISYFTLDWVYIGISNQELLDECVKSGLQTKEMQFEIVPGSEVFLNAQLNSEVLTGFIVRNLHEPLVLYDRNINALEAFVCRPNFDSLECHFYCLGTECLKRIVDYWTAMESPWKSSRLVLNSYPTKCAEFASWLPRAKRSGWDMSGRVEVFEWKNGALCLTVNCSRSYSVMQFKTVI